MGSNAGCESKRLSIMVKAALLWLSPAFLRSLCVIISETKDITCGQEDSSLALRMTLEIRMINKHSQYRLMRVKQPCVVV